jgi:hypothetical protein
MLIELKYDGHDVAVEQRVAGIVEATGMTDGCSGGLSDAWNRLSIRSSDFAEAHATLPP